MSRKISQAELIARALESRIADVETMRFGIVEAYDATSRSAEVRPFSRRPVPKEDGTGFAFEELPILPSVPVAFPLSGGAKIVFPIEVGTMGLILFSSEDVGPYLASEQAPEEPQDLRKHSLSHGVFVPLGVLPFSQSLPEAQEDAIVIEHATTIKIGANATDKIAKATPTNDNFQDLVSAINGATAGGDPIVWMAPSLADVSATKGEVE